MASLTVAYATETGRAEEAAARVVRSCEARGVPVTLLPFDERLVPLLPSLERVVFITSTAGQGEFPPMARGIWRWLLKRSLSPSLLLGQQFGVFGLGDSAYVTYNTAAKKLRRRLEQLGAALVLPFGLGDDQARGGYDVALDSWMEELWRAVGPVPVPEPDPAALLGRLKVRAKVVAAGGGAQGGWDAAEAAAAATTYSRMRGSVLRKGGFTSDGKWEGEYGPERPFLATITANEKLSTLSDRDVRHIEVSLEGSNIEYAPGDVLAVIPRQRREDVARLCRAAGIEPSDTIELSRVYDTQEEEGQKEEEEEEDDDEENVVEVCAGALVDGLIDINSGSPSRFFFEMLAHFATKEIEKERLEYFSSGEGREDCYNYNESERRTLLEVLEDFPSSIPTLEWLLQTAPRLKARQFSISSSLSVHRNSAHITAAVVRVTTPYKREREGLCTAYLSKSLVGESVAVWVETGSIHLPKDEDAPLILIGPGTGVAPFRAFVECCHDQVTEGDMALGMARKKRRTISLFFGCRSEAGDFLYGDEWKMRATAEDFHLFTAFSRDQEKKCYVSHRIREAGEFLVEQLERGAYVYVCGSASKMPEDVREAFEAIIARYLRRESAAAKQYLRDLERRGRYQIETWS